MSIRRHAKEYLIFGLIGVAVIVGLNMMRPTLSPEQKAAADGIRWARDNPSASINACPTDRGNDYWMACQAEIERMAVR